MTKIILAILLGGAFGFALYNAGAAYRKNIRSMLRLEDLTVMKIILFAIGLAGALIAAANLIGIFNIGHFSIKSMNAGVILGGIIFGLGFGAVGNCPGTALASFTYPNKIKTLGMVAGGLVGAWLFSLSYGWWVNAGLYKTLDMGKITLFKVSPKIPSLLTIGHEGLLALSLVFMAIAYVLPQKVKG